MKSKRAKNCFVSYPVKFLILAGNLLKCFSELYWNCFSFRVMFWKSSYQCLTAVQKLQISATLLLIHDIIIIIIINLFRQEFNESVCSGHWKIFVITCIFDIMQFDNLLQLLFNCSYRGSMSYKLELLNLSSIGHLPPQSEQ